MGRDSGLIALRSGIGVGAEAILLPEVDDDLEKMYERLANGRKDKSSKIIIVAEGDDEGEAFPIAQKVNDRFQQYANKVAVLGHIQLDEKHSCAYRVLANQPGY